MAEISLDEVLGYATDTGPAHLATSSPAGDPHVALAFAVRVGDGIVFTMRTTSAKAANLRANPRLSLMWQGNGAETYLWGRATIQEDAATKNEVWNGGHIPFDLSHFYGSVDSAAWCVVRVEPTRAVVMAQTDKGLERHTWSVK